MLCNFLYTFIAPVHKLTIYFIRWWRYILSIKAQKVHKLFTFSKSITTSETQHWLSWWPPCRRKWHHRRRRPIYLTANSPKRAKQNLSQEPQSVKGNKNLPKWSHRSQGAGNMATMELVLVAAKTADQE